MIMEHDFSKNFEKGPALVRIPYLDLIELTLIEIHAEFTLAD